MKKANKNSVLSLKLFLLASAITLVFPFFQRNTQAESDDASDIKDSISSLQKKLDKEQEEKDKLEQELGQIQSSVNYAQSQINKTEKNIEEVKDDIDRTEEEIKTLSDKNDFQKKVLTELLQELYLYEKSSMIDILLSSDNILAFLGGSDHLIVLEQKVTNLIQEINETKNKVEEDKQDLLEKQEEHERLLSLKKDQQQDLVADKVETQSFINQKDATIGELQGKLSKLQGELSKLLGTSFNAKNIKDAAKFASKVTGVRKDFILGMLVVESDLGRFTGGCQAKDSNMSGTRLKLFKDICEELDYNWKTRKVSCPPRSYKGTGGAMGVAQFMSDTWMGYKSAIAGVTGHNPPDPWDLTDGVTAMGLKLARGGATKKSGECNAAKLYLSGTTSSKYNWYCDRVLYWADNYEKLMD